MYSCPSILGLIARLVWASEQAEPASQPGNRSLSSIRMHCQWRPAKGPQKALLRIKRCREIDHTWLSPTCSVATSPSTQSQLQRHPLVLNGKILQLPASNDCGERSTAFRTKGTPNGCGSRHGRANLARISRTPSRSDLSRVVTNPVRSIRWTWIKVRMPEANKQPSNMVEKSTPPQVFAQD